MRKAITRKTAQLVLDVLVLVASFALAVFLRFDWEPPAEFMERSARALPAVLTAQLGMLWAFGLRRYSWRFFGLREAINLGIGVAASTALLATVRLVGLLGGPYLPWGVLLIDAVLSFLALGGIRVAVRLYKEDRERVAAPDPAQQPVPTILIGAGQAGVLVARELENRPDLNLLPVGFVDDDPAKHGLVIQGLEVLGPTAKLGEIARQKGARQALITIAAAPRKTIRQIALLCEQAGIAAKVVPGLFEVVRGTASLSHIRDVAIEDLLGREPVELDLEAIGDDLRDRVVLVTGAGGSIGSELCRQIARFRPRELVLVEQAENALFLIHRELSASFPDLAIVPCVADVCDAVRMRNVFAAHRPEAVFHAAAHKHVPMMEWNPGEAVKNNVLGTRVVADLAHAFSARQFVLISTDKAVNPTSVMGATKRLAEMYVQALSATSPTRFVTVRFGNVLGSKGSVIPIFREQLKKGGPITVTHPEMRRYFMTIPEACQLVLQAGSMGLGGEIFVLDMGEPVKILDLALDLIRLSGLRPYEDIDIVFTGIRPGEKLFEELSTAEEHVDKTRHPKIFIGRVVPEPLAEVTEKIDRLVELADRLPPAELRSRLAEAVPEYEPEERRLAAAAAGAATGTHGVATDPAVSLTASGLAMTTQEPAPAMAAAAPGAPAAAGPRPALRRTG